MLLKTPKTAKGRRELAKKDARISENSKIAVFFKTKTSSLKSSFAMRDLYALKKPNAVLFSKRNDFHPFSDFKPLEFFSNKNQASLFCIASHSKKRQDAITFVRMFDYQVIDIIEFSILNVIPIEIFQGIKPAVGMRPLLVFQGSNFDSGHYGKIKDFFIDFFRGDPTDEINLNGGLSHTISFTCNQDLIHLRVYANQLLKSDSTTPRVELVECGPAITMRLGRSQFCPDDIFKIATRVPKVVKPSKVKNVSRDRLGDKIGRVHMLKQDFGKLQTRKMKGLKKTRDEKVEEKKKDI